MSCEAYRGPKLIGQTGGYETDSGNSFINCPLDCSRRGNCVGGVCQCAHGFTGSGCQFWDQGDRGTVMGTRGWDLGSIIENIGQMFGL